jgi:hypothetical protein
MLLPAPVMTAVLQQDSLLLLNESGDEYPPALGGLTKPDGNSTAWSDKADRERIGSTVPAQGVSGERFYYFFLNLLFLICSEPSKGRICTPLNISNGLSTSFNS